MSALVVGSCYDKAHAASYNQSFITYQSRYLSLKLQIYLVS